MTTDTLTLDKLTEIVASLRDSNIPTKIEIGFGTDDMLRKKLGAAPSLPGHIRIHPPDTSHLGVPININPMLPYGILLMKDSSGNTKIVKIED
ncbi:MAG: hypothetical protein Q7Q73_07410 [Verrucomicrobiota bacterium JB024]|nr:hypothetical protein [Verrucomicrobiota bacterium JB024]